MKQENQHAWQMQAIQEGIDALDKGLGIPHAIVCQLLEEQLKDALTTPPMTAP
jgi:hypothetical protein